MTPWLIAAPALAAGFAGLTAYGAVHPRAQIFGHGVYCTNGPEKLALTFDDGPNPAMTHKLLVLLEKYQAKATFFVVGKYVRESPVLVREIVSRGHLLGNHTDSHPNLFFCGPEETREELRRCTDAIVHSTQTEPRWFRPPFGFRSPWLGEIVQRQNMRMVLWTSIPGDWRPKPSEWLIQRMSPIAEHVQEKASRQNGDVLCLHDGDYSHPNGDRARTLAALEYWLPRWRDLGLEFVTISQATRKAVEGDGRA